MPGARHNKFTTALAILCVALLGISGLLFWNYGMLKIRVAFADEQTRIFDDMRATALRSDAKGAAQCLAYVVSYYPSGSKQETGSRLDTIVERERESAEREIINYLHAKTGENLGTSPDAWIRKYGL